MTYQQHLFEWVVVKQYAPYKWVILAEFKPYMSVFDKFGFGLRVRSRLLTRIYPFESFLGVNGRPVIEYDGNIKFATES
ncbi:MAG: hypothetical protein RM368_29640 [Nostoc sp. DedSLP03]|uniref:hypothetical protein n=1 Tax=Nostoc sp. DedSLP03 TaxID=3075400 RepID=UPI002AD3FD18|nr:hypothetical protein [Nostoc sp. DedSLP03]MDZ7969068.1 hypothetical protein [Nostoc sp. DedSLP03]